jgi:serine/threonine protein kinase
MVDTTKIYLMVFTSANCILQMIMNIMWTISSLKNNVDKCVLICVNGYGDADQQHVRKLDWSTRFKIILGIAQGLEYLHERCFIVHGDLKPTNILLDKDYNPKIANFEFACDFSLHNQPNLTRTFLEQGRPSILIWIVLQIFFYPTMYNSEFQTSHLQLEHKKLMFWLGLRCRVYTWHLSLKEMENSQRR